MIIDLVDTNSQRTLLELTLKPLFHSSNQGCMIFIRALLFKCVGVRTR